MTPDQQRTIVQALERGNTREDAAALAAVSEHSFWLGFVEGKKDTEEGRETDAAEFYLAALEAEAKFADGLLTRAAGEDESRALLSVLERRHVAWGKKEQEYQRIKEQEQERFRFPIEDEEARGHANALLRRLASLGEGRAEPLATN